MSDFGLIVDAGFLGGFVKTASSVSRSNYSKWSIPTCALIVLELTTYQDPLPNVVIRDKLSQNRKSPDLFTPSCIQSKLP